MHASSSSTVSNGSHDDLPKNEGTEPQDDWGWGDEDCYNSHSGEATENLRKVEWADAHDVLALRLKSLLMGGSEHEPSTGGTDL